MAAPILGIEYSKDSIKIVEVIYGRRLKILNFAVIENSSIPQERRAEHLQHTLQTRGFEAKQAIVAVSGAGIEHRLLTLPPLSSREMQFVMTREARKVMTSKDMVWTYDVIGVKEELGIKKNEIMLVTGEAESVKAPQDALASAKFKVTQLTTIADSLVNLLSNTGSRSGVKCVVHFAGNRVHMVFVREGSLLLSRDIPFDYTSIPQDEQVNRLITEFKRSSLFFRQNFPQASLDGFLFSGDTTLLGPISAASKEEFGIESGMLRFEEFIDTSGLRGDWDTLRFNLPALGVALGAAWRKKPGTGINLLPNSKPSNRSAAGAGRAAKYVIPAALAIVLLSGGHYLGEKGRSDAERLEMETKISELQPVLDQAARDQAQAQLAATRNALVQKLTVHKDWTELLRTLSFVVPQNAWLDEIRIERQEKDSLILRGSIASASMATAYADFNRFLSNLRGIPQLASVLSTKNPPPVVNEGFQSRAQFEVLCELN